MKKLILGGLALYGAAMIGTVFGAVLALSLEEYIGTKLSEAEKEEELKNQGKTATN